MTTSRSSLPAWRIRQAGVKALIYAAAAALAVFSLFPLLWMLLTSVKPRAEIISPEPVFWPSDIRWENYLRVLEADFTTYLRNSLLVTSATTLLGVLVAIFAGYALARFRMPLRRYLLVIVLATQMFPMVVLIIPFFIVMRDIGLLGNLWGLVIAYLSFTTPLAVWILRGFFMGIPDELEQAALVDGCTRFGAMWRVILPLAGPGIAACAIFSWIAAWNEFLFALTFVKEDSLRTLPLALQAFVGRAATDHGAVMAASVLFTLPVVVFFLLVHKKLTTGMVAGAVKG